jgi:hypothetical protein
MLSMNLIIDCVMSAPASFFVERIVRSGSPRGL